MKEHFKEDALFKALGHPTRRKILRYIGSRGEASYTELAMIEPKSGVLYHHLRLLGDLIYQDERKLYRLTDKGYRALEFLEDVFFEPVDTSINKFLTPRWLLERVEGAGSFVLLLVLYFLSSITWIFQRNYVLIFILALPLGNILIPSVVVAYLSWIGSSLILALLVKLVYERHIEITRILILNTIPFALINVSVIATIPSYSNQISLLITAIIQFYALLLIISNISVTARINLRKSAIIAISLHYLSMIIYLSLILTL